MGVKIKKYFKFFENYSYLCGEFFCKNCKNLYFLYHRYGGLQHKTKTNIIQRISNKYVIMEAINIKAYTADNSQIDAIKAFMKALKIKFEVSKEVEKPYNEAFVKKIKQGDEDLKNGKGRTVTLEELDSLWK
jgi:hypothetical protein